MADNLSLLAAELALGLSPASERRDAEHLRATDSAFAAEVARWEAVTESWLAELADEPTSAGFWARTTASIAPMPRISAPPVTLPRPAAAPGPGLWRPLAIAASVVACVLAGLLARHDTTPPPTISQPGPTADGRFSIAQLSGTGDPHLATVLYDRASGMLTIRIAAMAPDPARVPELWLINGNSPPHSLGFGNTGSATRMQASARLKRSLVDGATLAITLEPISAQPHAAPSSRILGTGTISSL